MVHLTLVKYYFVSLDIPVPEIVKLSLIDSTGNDFRVSWALEPKEYCWMARCQPGWGFCVWNSELCPWPCSALQRTCGMDIFSFPWRWPTPDGFSWWLPSLFYRLMGGNGGGDSLYSTLCLSAYYLIWGPIYLLLEAWYQMCDTHVGRWPKK